VSTRVAQLGGQSFGIASARLKIDRDIGSLGRKGSRNGATDTACSARDQCLASY
jgi:hypothetical protein